jgi:hypothetical protein
VSYRPTYGENDDSVWRGKLLDPDVRASLQPQARLCGGYLHILRFLKHRYDLIYLAIHFVDSLKFFVPQLRHILKRLTFFFIGTKFINSKLIAGLGWGQVLSMQCMSSVTFYDLTVIQYITNYNITATAQF